EGVVEHAEAREIEERDRHARARQARQLGEEVREIVEEGEERELRLAVEVRRLDLRKPKSLRERARSRVCEAHELRGEPRELRAEREAEPVGPLGARDPRERALEIERRIERAEQLRTRDARQDVVVA